MSAGRIGCSQHWANCAEAAHTQRKMHSHERASSWAHWDCTAWRKLTSRYHMCRATCQLDTSQWSLKAIRFPRATSLPTLDHHCALFKTQSTFKCRALKNGNPCPRSDDASTQRRDRRLRAGCWLALTMTMTLREVQHLSDEGLALQARV